MLHTITIRGKVTPSGAMQLKSTIGLEDVKTVGHIFQVNLDIEICDQFWFHRGYLTKETFVKLEDVTGLGFIAAHQVAADKAITPTIIDLLRGDDVVHPNFETYVRQNIKTSIEAKIKQSA